MSVSGNTDLQIEFTDGKKLLTGRHKHEKKTEILRKFDKIDKNDCANA